MKRELSELQIWCLRTAGSLPGGVVRVGASCAPFSRTTARSLAKCGLLEHVPAATAWAHYRITALGRERLAALESAELARANEFEWRIG